jgi:ferredoxin
MDQWLKKRLDKYDQWLSEGSVAYTSKVIPVAESLTAQPAVLPTEQVYDYLAEAKVFAVADCVCRTHYQRCDNPVEVCFFVDAAAEALLAKDQARRLSLAEARDKLALADAHGLVHMTLHMPGQQSFAICSCCACCCHDLQFLLRHGRKDLIAPSAYRAVQDWDVCLHCGDCADRCPFEARRMADGALAYEPDLCYGCGLCATACPVDAVDMDAAGGLAAVLASG